MMKNLSLNQKGISQILVLCLVILVVLFGVYFLMKKSPSDSQVKSQPELTAVYDLKIVGTDASPVQAPNTISLPLIQGDCKLNVMSGDFKVESSDCTSNAASFYLPSASIGEEETSTYEVYYKALDSKLGADPKCKQENGESFCPMQAMVIVGSKESNFTSDVSKLLTYVYLDLEGKGMPERYSLFDDELKAKVWAEDSSGRLVSLKFYPQSTKQIEKEGSEE